jgi:ABC-2 type transport system ATP-binding protein
MLELRNIKKQYDLNIVLDIPFLKLDKGIYWLKGANGSGKTTLLKMVAGLLPFKGDILYRGISLKNKPRIYRQNISWAEAEPLFPSFIAGKDVVRLYVKIRQVLQKEADNLVELFQMTESINSAIGTYSAGMTKKLSLVLAFLGDPPLIVLDEPLITLDPGTFNAVSALILEKNRTAGSSFLLSSHQELHEELSVFANELTIINRAIVVK